MKVVYPLAVADGGLPHYAAELANAVAETEDVVVLKPTETSADDVFADAVEVVDAFDPPQVSIPDIYRLDVNPLDVLRSLRSYTALDTIPEYDPDLVHDVMGLFAHLKFFAHRHDLAARYPFVVTFHELHPTRYPLSHPPTFVSHLVKDLLPEVPIDAGVVHTTGQADILRSSRYSPGAVEVIPHGAYDFFTDYDYEQRSVEDGTVLFFGNVIPEKGVEELVSAVQLVAEEIPEARLVVAGKGTLPERSRKIVAEYPEQFEIHDRYVPNDEVGTLFSRAQVVAVPYRDREGSRGHSGALSTAFSFGKPVVGSDAGDFPELVGDSGAGRVVEAGDVGALADGLVEVLSDDDAREEMAANSEAMAERLSWENVASRHLDLYDRAIEHFQRRVASGGQARPAAGGHGTPSGGD